MNRIHFFEWGDLRWFPNSWRDFGTDFLKFIATKFNIYKPIEELLKTGLKASEDSEWIDCASGGGSGLSVLAVGLQKEFPQLRIILTDYYPNIKAFQELQKKYPTVFQYIPTPVDARNVPPHLQQKFRTLFGSFHHFRTNDATAILQNAVDQKSPIGIFEPVGRNFMSAFSMLFMVPNVLLLAPFVKPFRWSVLPFIYIIPIIPLYILWDGIVSMLRNYSADELKRIINKLNHTEDFYWEVGQKTHGPSNVNYLLGVPKDKISG